MSTKEDSTTTLTEWTCFNCGETLMAYDVQGFAVFRVDCPRCERRNMKCVETKEIEEDGGE